MGLIWAFVVLCLAYLFPILFVCLVGGFFMAIFGLFTSRSNTSSAVNRHFTNKP